MSNFREFVGCLRVFVRFIFFSFMKWVLGRKRRRVERFVLSFIVYEVGVRILGRLVFDFFLVVVFYLVFR